MDALGRRLAFAIRYFTRFPLPLNIRIVGGDIARSSALFPFVAIFEGIFIALVVLLVSWFGNLYLTVAAALFARYLISRGQVKGAAHGLDGLSRSRDRVRMVEAMFDEQYGTIGICTILFDFLLKGILYWELYSFMSVQSATMIVIASCIAGKLSVVSGATTSNSVFGNDKMIDDSKVVWDLLICTAFSYVFLLLLLGWMTAGLSVLVAISIGLILSGLIVMKLGGLTKQTLGVLHELGEIMLLFILLVW